MRKVELRPPALVRPIAGGRSRRRTTSEARDETAAYVSTLASVSCVDEAGLGRRSGGDGRALMANADNAHEASASAAGYLFQCRYALFAGLRAIPNVPELKISIEKFDDVGFEAQGEPTQLIQTKHHIGKQGNLTDASPDLWKTLLIWCKRVAQDIDAPFRMRFVLLTTGAATDDSAASFLRVRDRDEHAADKRLLKVVATSKSKDNAAAYAAYAALPDELRLSLLRAINVLDGSPNIIDVRDEIARELYHAAARDQLDLLVKRLEGWWFGVVVKALTGAGPNAVPVLAIDQRVDELREEFKRSALPVDFRSQRPPARGYCRWADRADPRLDGALGAVPCPCRTNRARPSGSFRSSRSARNASTSRSTACVLFRRRSVAE